MIANVWCFDFDGVICDSARETGNTGWHGAAQLWPERFPGLPSAAFTDRFRRLRPVIETGYESILLARFIVDGLPDDRVIEGFRALVDRTIVAENLDEARLIRLFGGIRDRWLRERPEDWLDLHDFYAGVPAFVQACQAAGEAVYIITTKEHRFAVKLAARAGIELPAVFGLEAGGKVDVLRRLRARPRHAGAVFHFFEDRLKTLRKVIAAPDLAAVRLYLATWGYCLPSEQQAAAREPRVTGLDLEHMQRGSFAPDPS